MNKLSGSAKWEAKKRLLLERFGSKCYHCGIECTVDNCQHDHLIPRVKGGNDSKKNLVLSCLKCNLSKGGNLVDDWIVTIKDKRSELLKMVDYYEDIINLHESRESNG